MTATTVLIKFVWNVFKVNSSAGNLFLKLWKLIKIVGQKREEARVARHRKGFSCRGLLSFEFRVSHGRGHQIVVCCAVNSGSLRGGYQRSKRQSSQLHCIVSIGPDGGFPSSPPFCERTFLVVLLTRIYPGCTLRP